MDEGCSYPIQQGAKLSRARVYTFKHNDADDLAVLLERIEAGEKRERWVEGRRGAAAGCGGRWLGARPRLRGGTRLWGPLAQRRP
jgi:hypothetical protein